MSRIHVLMAREADVRDFNKLTDATQVMIGAFILCSSLLLGVGEGRKPLRQRAASLPRPLCPVGINHLKSFRCNKPSRS